MLPIENDFEAAKVDESLDLANDITQQMGPALREKDPKTRKELRMGLAEIILPRWFGYLDKLLVDNGDTGFIVGNSLSVADLAIWRLCGWISGGVIDGIPNNILEKFSLLNYHQEKISNLPKVKKWVKKNNY